MSVKSKTNSSQVKKEQAIDRPFDPAILERARAIADRYRLIIEIEDDEYWARAVEMSMVFGDGKTPNECVENTREALTSALATMIEAGEEPPSPASEEKRTEQVNVRLTKIEKHMLEEASRGSGFRGLSDFIRATMLARVRSA